MVKGGVRNAIRPGDSLTLEQGWAHDAYGPSGRVVLSGSVYITADWNGRELVLRS